MLGPRHFAASCIEYYHSGASTLNRAHGSNHLPLKVEMLDEWISLSERDWCDFFKDNKEIDVDLGIDASLIIYSRRLKKHLGGDFSTAPIFYGYLASRDMRAIGSGKVLQDRERIAVMSHKISDLLHNDPLGAYKMLKTYLKDFPR